jgi:oligogalacturonide lyase
MLLYASDRSGTWQIYRMDVRTGQSRQIGEAAKLDRRSLCLLPDERGACFLDGRSLCRVLFSSPGQTELYRARDDWPQSSGLTVSGDGLNAILVESNRDLWRLKLVGLVRHSSATVAEAPEPISAVMPRPGRAVVLYRRGIDSLWLAGYDGRENRRLCTADGEIGTAVWSSDGRTVLYLLFPPGRAGVTEIREHVPELNTDRMIVAAGKLASFSPNADATVFAAAGASVLSPFVTILLRATGRELVLCEHRSSDPALVAPQFSGDSQRLFFQSDRHGKLAIYTMRVDRLVEKTET